MKVLAIWERPQADVRHGGTFFLLDNTRLLHISHTKEYMGTDAEGNRKYKETGLLISDAFEHGDQFDFDKAHHFLKYFGGKLVARF